MKEVSACVKGIKENRIWGILYNKVRRAVVINMAWMDEKMFMFYQTVLAFYHVPKTKGFVL